MSYRRYTYDQTLGPPSPNSKILFCPYCGHEIHRSWPEDGLTPQQRVELAEDAAIFHFHEEHRWRYEIWQRTGWKWLIGGLAR